jgi:hypothetical protein
MIEGIMIAGIVIGDATLDREELRARLRRMTKEELARFGRVVRKMCSLETDRGKTPREEVVVQFEEAWAEWTSRCTQSLRGHG